MSLRNQWESARNQRLAQNAAALSAARQQRLAQQQAFLAQAQAARLARQQQHQVRMAKLLQHQAAVRQQMGLVSQQRLALSTQTQAARHQARAAISKATQQFLAATTHQRQVQAHEFKQNLTLYVSQLTGSTQEYLRAVQTQRIQQEDVRQQARQRFRDDLQAQVGTRLSSPITTPPAERVTLPSPPDSTSHLPEPAWESPPAEPSPWMQSPMSPMPHPPSPGLSDSVTPAMATPLPWIDSAGELGPDEDLDSEIDLDHTGVGYSDDSFATEPSPGIPWMDPAEAPLPDLTSGSDPLAMESIWGAPNPIVPDPLTDAQEPPIESIWGATQPLTPEPLSELPDPPMESIWGVPSVNALEEPDQLPTQEMESIWGVSPIDSSELSAELPSSIEFPPPAIESIWGQSSWQPSVQSFPTPIEVPVETPSAPSPAIWDEPEEEVDPISRITYFVGNYVMKQQDLNPEMTLLQVIGDRELVRDLLAKGAVELGVDPSEILVVLRRMVASAPVPA